MRLSTIRARRAVLLVTAFGLLASQRASLAESRGRAAQAGQVGNLLKSRQHFLAGKRAFESRDYPRALAEFGAGYDLEPRPGFLLNMGHAARKMGDLRQAEQLYRRFLATGPVGAERRTAEKLIAQMKKGLAPETEPPAPVTESALAAEPADPPAAPVAEAVRDGAPPSTAETPPEATASAAEPEPPAPPRARSASATPATATVATERSLHLSLDEPAPPATQATTAFDPAAASAPAGEPVYRRWWFWTGVGALAVGVAAAVLVGMGSGSTVHDSGSWGQVKL